MSLDFIGVGSGKCGSTWLFEMIQSHPQVFDGNAKELNFFSDRYQYYEKGSAWYRRQFSGATPDQKCGEFSVTYMYEEVALRRLKYMFPDVRLLMVVRDPVERAFSDYQHEIRKGLISEKCDFGEFVRTRYDTGLGRFAEAISLVEDYFHEDQLLVIPLNAMKLVPEKALARVYEHIGVDTDFLPDNVGEVVNKAFVPRVLAVERIITRGSRFLTMSGNVALLESLKRTGLVSRIRSLNSSKRNKTIPSAESKMLRQVYSREIDFIAQLESSYGIGET